MNIIYPQSNNKLAIITPCVSLETALKDVPANTPYKVVDTLDIVDIFFDAYEFDLNAGVVLNIKNAKEIKREMFRQVRKPLLEKLDVDYMRAVEGSNTVKKKSIAAKKKLLRDVTNIDMPNDVGELVKFWPDVLNSA